MGARAMMRWLLPMYGAGSVGYCPGVCLSVGSGWVDTHVRAYIRAHTHTHRGRYGDSAELPHRPQATARS